jgi:hypothetical protein
MAENHPSRNPASKKALDIITKTLERVDTDLLPRPLLATRLVKVLMEQGFAVVSLGPGTLQDTNNHD